MVRQTPIRPAGVACEGLPPSPFETDGPVWGSGTWGGAWSYPSYKDGRRVPRCVRDPEKSQWQSQADPRKLVERTDR